MSKFYGTQDVDTTALQGKRVAVLGYGSQGKAQALNLRDSGLDVVLGLRPGGQTWKAAEHEGWKPVSAKEAVSGADVVAMLVPDMAQPALYEEAVATTIKSGASILFSHGFNIHFGQITAPANVDVIMIAPKSPGYLVRETYLQGHGVPCILAVHQDASGHALSRALAYADALGGTKAGVIETTFKEETETDLFGEQAVLCGGVTELVAAGFETLVEAGYQPEVAYFECLHELKLIVDLIYAGGFARMHKYVSETAKYGDLSRGPRIVTDETRVEMRRILGEVQNGDFAKEWIAENKAGLPKYNALLKKDLEHPIEKVGRELRSRMSWLKTNDE